LSEKLINPYPVLKISRKALRNNLEVLKKVISRSDKDVKVLIPVKANAYGFGISTLLPFFQEEKIEYLGVANPYEGEMLRNLGWRHEILNLGGFYRENADDFFKNKIIPSVTDIWQISLLNERAKAYNQKANIQLKLDFGMGRIGFKEESFHEMITEIKKAENLKVTGIFIHLPSADSDDMNATRKIIEKFSGGAKYLINELNLKENEVLLHAANSYGTLLYPESHFDMIRPGLVFYGYFQNRKDKEKLEKKYPIKPALSLWAKPISVRDLKKGDTISYGSTYTVEKENINAGVFPLGYADGILRALSNNIVFEDYPLLGRVTMDQIVLGGVYEKEKYVQIIGEKSPPLEYWADAANTITYEILTGFGGRLQRELV